MPSPKWTADQVQYVLEDKLYEDPDLTVSQTRQIQDGTQFVLKSGTVIDVYDSGKVVPKGTKCGITEEAKQIFSSPFSSYQPVARPNVFIVYGHHQDSRDVVEAMVREFGLKPIILDQIAGGGNTIIEQLEAQIGNAAFACVLLTPDDEGHRICKPAEKKPRARQNVVFELGMVVGRLGRDRVAIFHLGNLERPTDILDLIYISLEDTNQAKQLFMKHLKEVGIHFLSQASV